MGTGPRERTSTGSTGGAGSLLERQDEFGRLQAAIEAAAQGSGGLVLIEGPAGIGKTALLSAARELAGRCELRVMSARAHELEAEFAFGVARQLFEPVLLALPPDTRARLLDGAAGLAGPLFEAVHSGGRLAPGADAERSFTLIHGLYWLSANLAEDRPALLAIDDAHSADLPTLQFLAYLAARCEELAILLVVTVRSGEPTRARALLTSIGDEPGGLVIEPRPLTADGVRTMVRAGLGSHAEPAFCDSCARATGGNPFLLGELIAALAGERVAPTADNAPSVEEVGPESVSRVVLTRLGRLGPDAQVLARAVAVLERAPLQQAAALAELDAERARTAADRLAAADILGPGAPLAFAHPLLRRAVYGSIPPAWRAERHRRAALLLAAQGTPAASLGAHLLRGEPAGDPSAVALLRSAAADALSVGDPGTATRLLLRALHEPPAQEDRGAVLGELGGAEALAQVPAASEHLRDALELAEQPAERVRVACTLAQSLAWSGRLAEAHEMLDDTIQTLGGGVDPALLATVEAIRTGIASIDRRMSHAIDARLSDLHELAMAAGQPGRSLLIFEGCWRAQRQAYDGGWRELLDRGLDDGRFVAEHSAGSQIVDYAAAILVLGDEPERARRLLSEIRTDARRRGSIRAHLNAVGWNALLLLRAGRLREAASDAHTALELAEHHGVLWMTVWSSAVLAEALLATGEVDRAEATLDAAPIAQVLGSPPALHAMLAQGRVWHAQGRGAEAIAQLRRTGESTIVDNPSYVSWRSALALALAHSDPAQGVELAESELARARELGQPRGIGVALRTVARFAEGEHAITLLSQSVEMLRGSPARLELSRSLCALGAAQRRAGQRIVARGPLREAAELADDCGADPLGEQARAELLASGARLRRRALSGPEALTPSELRIAELAAAGRTNREIAQALFITVKTVGTHLGHTYQKLDLSGPEAREGLAERLASATGCALDECAA
ncbi:MAG: ATP-binding protein [Solirubrobacteraceae bacterium]